MKKSDIRPEIVEIIDRIRKHQRISFTDACWQIINATKCISIDHNRINH